MVIQLIAKTVLKNIKLKIEKLYLKEIKNIMSKIEINLKIILKIIVKNIKRIEMNMREKED